MEAKKYVGYPVPRFSALVTVPSSSMFVIDVCGCAHNCNRLTTVTEYWA